MATLDLARGPLLQRLVGVAGLLGQPDQRTIDLAVALAQDREHAGPQPHAKLIGIVVARIVDELEADRDHQSLGQLASLRASQREQRSQPGRLVHGHAREPIEPGPAREVHEHGLGLIGRGVGQHDRRRSELVRLLEQRSPTRLASARGHSGSGRQRQPRALKRQPELLRQTRHLRGLAGRLGAQTMIDMTHADLEPEPRTQRHQQAERRDRVCAARARDQDLSRVQSQSLDRSPHRAERMSDRRILGCAVRAHSWVRVIRFCRIRGCDYAAGVDKPDLRIAPTPPESKIAPEDLQRVVEEPLSLERDDAAELIAALPVQGFVTVARKLRDEQRLDLLLPHASAEQIVGIFDLDSWEQDRLAVVRAREWLDRIAEAYREANAPRGQLVELMHTTDLEIWILANAAATAIADLEPGDDEQRMQVFEDMSALQTWETPDGLHIVGVPNDEFGNMTLRVLGAVYDDSMVEGRKLVSAIKWSTYTELEEDLLRWRRGRLADLGFPEWEEAMRLFAPLGHDAVMGREGGESERKRSPLPYLPGLAPSLRSEGKDLLRRVMEVLSESEYDLRLREFLLLANELMAAQRFEPGDEVLQTRAVDQARATLNLACEVLVARESPDDPEGFIAARITSVGLRKLFRYGYGPLHKLRKAALALHKGGQVSLREVGSLLDRPWGPALASFVRWFPELPIESATQRPSAKLATRPLRTLADLARATSLMGEAEALGRLTFTAQGYAVDPIWLTRVDDPARVHLGDLIRTAIIRARLPGASGFAPLGPDDLLWAREHLLDHGLVRVDVREEFEAKVAALGVPERAAALADVVLPRLGVELAGLEPDADGKLDMTKVGALLTIQQVGMWLTTREGVPEDVVED